MSGLCELPNLRFEDGNVVIKLGPSKEDWLLLHSSALADAVPLLASSVTRTGWERAESITNPATGETRNVYAFALKFVDDTWLLEGKDFITPCTTILNQSQEFHISTYGNEWKFRCTWRDPKKTLSHSIQAHKALFAILYGRTLSLKAIAGEAWRDIITATSVPSDLEWIARVGAYAEYYGCLDRVAPQLLEVLLAQPSIWVAVMASPSEFQTIGKKLRSADLYFDALRHLISRNSSCGWEQAGRELGASKEELRTFFLPFLEEQDATASQLRDDLYRLQLHEYKFRYDLKTWHISTSFLNRVLFKDRNRSEHAKFRERYDFFARSIYGQWLAERLVGDEVETTSLGRPRRAGKTGLQYACSQLLKAAEWKNPSRVFGYDAASRFVSIFNLGGHKSQRRLKNDLDQLVRDAARVINNTFATKEVLQEDGTVLTYRQNQFTERGRYFAYLPMPEYDVPWAEEGDWEAATQQPEVNMVAASRDALLFIELS